MAGFFGLFDFTKPGPGVPKDAPPKPRIVVFFGILTRKFWNLVKLNMMFFLFNIPALIVSILTTMILFQGDLIPKNITGLSKEDALVSEFFVRFMLAVIIMSVPLITVGPAQAGFTCILRNYAREEHAFIWGDFKETAIKNFKQSLIISLIDFFALLIMGVDLNVYISANKGNNNIFFTIASGLLVLAFVTYWIMHMYIYPMMITFKLSIRQIYKNALIFSIVNFFPNIGILLLCVLIIGVTFIYPILGILLFPLITMSFIGLLTNFHVYPKLKKYMIDKVENSNDNIEE